MSQSGLVEAKTVRQYADHIRRGSLTSEALVEHCLEVIEKTDSQIGAWAHIDSEQAVSDARAMDLLRKRGKPLGKLHGFPVGVKDIIDTQNFPTERGSLIFHGR